MPGRRAQEERFETAFSIKTQIGIGVHRLKTLALSGRVRFRIDPTRWGSCLYSVADVERYVAEATTGGRHGPGKAGTKARGRRQAVAQK